MTDSSHRMLTSTESASVARVSAKSHIYIHIYIYVGTVSFPGKTTSTFKLKEVSQHRLETLPEASTQGAPVKTLLFQRSLPLPMGDHVGRWSQGCYKGIALLTETTGGPTLQTCMTQREPPRCLYMLKDDPPRDLTARPTV